MFSDISHNAWFGKNTQYVVLSLIALLTGASLWFGYHWYTDRYEKNAYKDLAETIDGYYKALSSGDASHIVDAQRAFEIAGQRHKKSQLYPYFLAYKADALVQEGKQKEAIEVMDQLLISMNKKQPLFYLYSIKAALMKLDSSEHDLKQQGIKALLALSQDTANPVRDMALYYAGLNELYHGNKEEGKKLLQDLTSQGKTNSQWHILAEEKLRSQA